MKVKVHLVQNRKQFVAVAFDETGKKYLLKGATGGSTVEAETSAVLQVLAIAEKQDWDVELYYGGSSWKWADGFWCANKEVTQGFTKSCEEFRKTHSLQFMGWSDEETFRFLKRLLENE